MRSALPPVLFLTDPDRTPDPISTIRALPSGWGVIYRHFGRADAKKIGEELGTAARERNLYFSVSQDLALARYLGADGIHIPNRQLTGFHCSSLQGLSMTTSAHSASEVLRARRFGVDGVLLSPVFESQSPSTGKPIGLSRFKSFIRNMDPEIYALGGMTAENCIIPGKPVASVGSLMKDFKSKT